MDRPTETPTPAEIVAFWREAGPERWFRKDPAFDATIRARFLAAHEAAAAGAFDSWAATAEGALALLILLDQFPRNLFRDEARAFATDDHALRVARGALARGFDAAYSNPMRRLFCLPLMHSERLADQEECVALCRAAEDEEGVKFAILHRDIIARFGRFPHRNKLLGRPTTPQEQAFLDGGGFAG